MLEDRDYMRRRRGGRDENDPASGMRCLFTLIVVNVVAWILFRGHTLALIPGEFQSGAFWQPLTAMFLHDGLWHIFFNMFSLYIFGQIAAPELGPKRFLALYFVSGLFGNLLWLALNWNAPAALVGASGAVMGVIMAAAMIAPDVEMFLLFIPFPVKLRTMAIVFLALEIFSELSNRHSNVAYLAHIGGFIAGYLMMTLFFRQYVRWNPLAGKSGPQRKMPHGWHMNGEAPPPPKSGTGTGPVSQRELDYLLDKISREGINALSEQEMERLRQAREQMRGGQP